MIAGNPSQPHGTRRRRGESLRWRITTMLWLSGILTFLTIGSAVVLFTHDTEQQAWRDREEEATLGAAVRITAFLDDADDRLGELIYLDPDYVQSHPEVLGGVLGRESSFLEIVWLDAQANLRASAYRDEATLANVFTARQANWFRQASAGQTYLGGVQLAHKNEPYMILAIPAPDGEVVAARVQMTRLWEVVREIRIGDTGRALIVDRDGAVIAHTDPQFVLDWATVDGLPVLQTFTQTEEVVWNESYRSLAGTDVMGAAAPIQHSRWVVIAEVPLAEAYAATWKALFLLGGGVSLFGLLVLWLSSHFLLRFVVRPVEELGVGAVRIGRGQLDYRLAIARNNEIGRVAETFNQMAAQLQDRKLQVDAEIAERRRAEEALREARDELEMRVHARTEELAKANAALQLEIAERREAQEQIQASLREQEVLLKEIHHRVKNNLQVVSSLLNLQAGNIDSPATLEMLRESQNRVRSMALVHERLYRSKDLARVDFAEYLRDLTTSLFRSYRSRVSAVSLHLQVATDICLGIDVAIPCGLIVNELVSNALKHAFPGGRTGVITVAMEREDGRVVLCVRDNGGGLPAGFDYLKTESLGMQLVNTLTDQINGVLRLDANGGTTWTITFAA